MGKNWHKISALSILQDCFVGINEEMYMEILKDVLHMFIYFA